MYADFNLHHCLILFMSAESSIVSEFNCISPQQASRIFETMRSNCSGFMLIIIMDQFEGNGF